MSLGPSQTLREAVGFVSTRLDPTDEAADSKWVKIKIGPIPFAYPNTQGRKRLLAAHDLHHVLAGYDTSLAGEAQMGAWELGSGLNDRSAVRYAVRVFGFLVPIQPRRLFRAFVRGRHCRNLLDRKLDDATLSRSIGEMRAELGLDRPTPAPTADDRRQWRIWAFKGFAIVWGPLLPMGLLLWWWLA